MVWKTYTLRSNRAVKVNVTPHDRQNTLFTFRVLFSLIDGTGSAWNVYHVGGKFITANSYLIFATRGSSTKFEQSAAHSFTFAIKFKYRLYRFRVCFVILHNTVIHSQFIRQQLLKYMFLLCLMCPPESVYVCSLKLIAKVNECAADCSNFVLLPRVANIR